MLAVEKRIKTKQQLKQWLELELKTYPKGIRQLLPTEAAILRKHQILLRKTEYYTNVGNKLFAFIYRNRLSRIQNLYGMHIPINVCDKGLRIMHIGPVSVNQGATVGQNCSFHINTAVVAGGTNNDVPIIGDNVVIGVGAVVLGGVKIANGTAIGANAVVNKDVVEENIAVAGVPAKKISNNGKLTWNKKGNENS